jgi:hypothetical protein
MERWLRQALLACAVVLASFMARQIAACVCRGHEPPCFAYQKASAVFVGSVADIAEAPSKQGDTFEYLMIRFSIEQAFKGMSDAEANVATINGTDCDFGFKKGERYFVYAYHDSKHNRLVTGVCTRTKSLNYAEEDLAYAREASISSPKTSFCVRIVDGYRPVKDIKIVVNGEGRQYTAVADGKEFIYIELAKPGKYRVTVTGPKGFEFVPFFIDSKVFSLNGRPVIKFERTIDEGKCDFVDFEAFATLRKRR